MGGSTPYSLTKSHRTPWERLGISGPLFVIFLLMGGVTVCTLTWLINQQMHPLQMHPLQTHTLNSTLPGETNSLSFPSYLPQDHTVSRREVGVTKCTPQELKSTTLCLPFNATTTVYLPWGLLGHAQNSLGLPAWTYSSFNWYITKGGYGVGDLVTRIQAVDPQFLPTRTKREAALTVGDPTYIDAIGVPRGVPDEYKLVDQVAAGFESSLCWWCTVNKNVDRINYIHFNVQKLGNWTQQGFEAVHGQLAATSLMAFQNRIAVDMLLAEKGGICFMFGEQCCTFIPNNTASDGSLTVALEGLRTLNGKMKSHSGVDTSTWDSWMDAFGKYKVLVSSILVSISVFVAILTLCGCCCIPCARSLLSRVITSAIAPNNDPALMFPLIQQEDPLVEFETCTYE
uniref:Uncharacterized protein n=1 Tax=Oncorhynchus mykiss TaxID=8022 RepID=A0A8K9WYD6_ONCMY